MLRSLLPLLCCVTVAVAQPPKKKEDVPEGYKKDNLRGFTLYFSDEVFKQNEKTKLERTPLEALERELIIVETVLPADKVKSLKAVPIWVEWDERIAMNNGRAGSAVAVFYGGHQSNLLGGSKNPLKSNSVTILSLRSLAEEHQPKTDSGRCVTLHELAHAFHHLVVGGNNPLVTGAYKQAMERKLYDPGLYVATNDHEYFAELTCAYLDRLDYYPRTRDDLKKLDAKGYEMMEKLWGRPPARPAATAAKGPALPSPDGEGLFKLTGTADQLRFGKTLAGEMPSASDRKGKPTLVMMFPGRSGRALSMLPRLQAWHTELRDFGLVTVGVETSGAPSEAMARISRERGTTFPYADDAEIGIAGQFALPHALVYDHTGKCVFRGQPLDAEQYVRIAVGKFALSKVDPKPEGKPAAPVVELLERGAAMNLVFTKLDQQTKATSKANADELKAIDAVLTEGGKKILARWEEPLKTDPVNAFFELERLPTAYRGTSLEKPAQAAINKLLAKNEVARELRARANMTAVKKLDATLAGKDGSFDPRSLQFQDDNAFLLKQLAEAIVKFRKTYPNTRAADDAAKLAELWDVKLSEK